MRPQRWVSSSSSSLDVSTGASERQCLCLNVRRLMWHPCTARDSVSSEEVFLRGNYKITAVQTQDTVELPLL